MKDSCILHIGMPKTGSSTIQANLHAGISDTRAKYANLLEDEPSINQHGGMLCTILHDNPSAYHYVSRFGIHNVDQYSFKVKSRLEAGFKDLTTSIEIISGEDFFHLPSFSANGVEQLHSYLRGFFKHIKIFAYVRKPSSLLPSVFQQLVKFHGLNKLDPFALYHPYSNLKKYMDVFGAGNIVLRSYSPRIFLGGDIMIDFTTCVGIRPQKDVTPRLNTSLSKEAISMLFCYNRFCSEIGLGVTCSNPIFEKLIEFLHPFGGSKLIFSEQLIQSIVGLYSSDYDWIADLMDEEFCQIDAPVGDVPINHEYDLIECACSFAPRLSTLVGLGESDWGTDPIAVAKLVGSIIHRIQS